ncbi:hypothetical protein WUBG_13275 [Wuchereria bancrofti]|uniref:Uncharacterized protein n=1 Tax=Wuchereria bancrofti TaxID=6293 RepID=J9EFL3_WUCBA|nr:hypothetical protein WUBG_13275 [Wuchereria bancrofti]
MCICVFLHSTMLNIVNVPNLKILCSSTTNSDRANKNLLNKELKGSEAKLLVSQVSGESSLSSPPPPATPPPPPGIPYSVAVGLGTKNTKGSIVQTRGVERSFLFFQREQLTGILSP